MLVLNSNPQERNSSRISAKTLKHLTSVGHLVQKKGSSANNFGYLQNTASFPLFSADTIRLSAVVGDDIFIELWHTSYCQPDTGPMPTTTRSQQSGTRKNTVHNHWWVEGTRKTMSSFMTAFPNNILLGQNNLSLHCTV